MSGAATRRRLALRGAVVGAGLGGAALTAVPALVLVLVLLHRVRAIRLHLVAGARGALRPVGRRVGMLPRRGLLLIRRPDAGTLPVAEPFLRVAVVPVVAVHFRFL